ncbi:hypothetical protein CRENBAI_023056 [Crenichthys baileyi]|uniref:Uncharacterized protein n=1 Tax=Crenichthys baileyi TaxID=28760 RepID=A0AAV9RWN0_9TELE
MDLADSSTRDQWVQRQMEEAMRHLPNDFEVMPSPPLLEPMDREAAQRQRVREGCSFPPPQLQRSLPAPAPAAKPTSSSPRKNCRRAGVPSRSIGEEEFPVSAAACLPSADAEQPTPRLQSAAAAATSEVVTPLLAGGRVAASIPVSSSATAQSPRLAAVPAVPQQLSPRPVPTDCVPVPTDCVPVTTDCVPVTTDCVPVTTDCAPVPTDCVPGRINSQPPRFRLDASAPAHATEGLGDSSAPAPATEGLGDASASAHATEGLGDASASAHATEGLGDASASAHATDGLGDASASAHATEGLGDASASAHATDGLSDASASAHATERVKSGEVKQLWAESSTSTASVRRNVSAECYYSALPLCVNLNITATTAQALQRDLLLVYFTEMYSYSYSSSSAYPGPGRGGRRLSRDTQTSLSPDTSSSSSGESPRRSQAMSQYHGL